MIGSLLRRLLVAFGLALLVLVGVLLAVLPSAQEERAGSVFSTDSDGTRALYLLCESLGFPVEPWDAAPGDLDGLGALLVLSAIPEAPPGGPAPASRRSRDLAHYRRFLDEGGTLLVVGAGEDELEFLRETLALPGLEDLSSARAKAIGSVVLAGGEELVLGLDPEEYSTTAAGVVLARGQDGSVVALILPVSGGRVVLAGVPVSALGNRSLARNGEPALFFVRLLEALAPERVLFDEYALGVWSPPSLAALAFGPGRAWLTVHLLLLFAVLVWRSAWSGPFPRDPEPLFAASPLARAQGFGRLLARARRFDLLADLLRRGLLARWERRSGRRAPPGAPREQQGEELQASLRALARGDERRLERLRQLFDARPQDERELAVLARDLEALESALFPASDRKTPPTLGARPSAIGS